VLPEFTSSPDIVSKQQNQIRQWLLKKVPTEGWVKDLITSQHSATSASAVPASSINTTPSTSSRIQLQFGVVKKLAGDTVNRMELAEALMQEYLTAKQVWELERDVIIRAATPETLNDVTPHHCDPRGSA
jgi:ubiquinone biosynthesis protein COQ9